MKYLVFIIIGLMLSKSPLVQKKRWRNLCKLQI